MARLPRDLAWRNVWLLAATSLVADVSGEMLQAVLPFLLVAQGATGLGLGLTGGVTEGVGHAFKLVGGYVGDRVGRKRLLVGAGYLLAALSRFGVALGTYWPTSLGFRALDRVGKGLRTAPRDALLADGIPVHSRGRAFGLHRAGDTMGAAIGVLVTLALVWRWAGAPPGETESRVVLLAAVIGLFSVVPLFFLRPVPTPPHGMEALDAPSRRYAWFLAVTGVFHLGQVSYLFFILRAAEGPAGGLPPIVAGVGWYFAFNVVYVAASYPAGWVADRLGRTRVLGMGFGLAACASALFVLRPSALSLGAGFLMLGGSYAASEGLGRAVAADLAGARNRSRRLGWYHFAAGIGTLLGSIGAGALWDVAGHAAAFAWGVVWSAAGLAGLALWTRRPAASPVL